MQEGPNSKQQIADKIKESANILVTVSSNPSVDSLAAALGLTLMLIKLDKHATAVFSGVLPPAISFLDPGKTFENNIDSLRDFIIALDKEKADRLRYKVEDDVVRIFITPYRTKITEKDLQFSQGDFNVDLIIALGVEDQKELDQAITAHGRILHDATVVTVNAASQKSNLGSIDWQDGNASSLSEMLASLAESLKPGVLDQQISTALLTGIVASTERFSNQRTTPRVMTISAQLMAAGANQQLIASKLQTIPAPVSPRKEKPRQDNRQQGKKQGADETAQAVPNGEMQIEHNEPTSQPEAIAAPAVAKQPQPVQQQKQQQNKQQPKQFKQKPVPAPQQAEPEIPIAPPAAQAFDELKEAIRQETIQGKPEAQLATEPSAPGSKNINEPSTPPAQPKTEGYLTTRPSWQGRDIEPPSMGGSLSATAQQALEDKQRTEQEEKRNRTILTHGGPQQPEAVSDTTPAPQPELELELEPETPTEPQPLSEPVVAEPPVEVAPQVEPVSMPEPEQPAVPIEPPVELAPPPPIVEPIEQPASPEPQPQIVEPAAPPLIVSEPVMPVEPPIEQPPIEATQPTPAVQMPEPIPQPPITPAFEPTQTAPTLEQLEQEAAAHAAQAATPQTMDELQNAQAQAMPQPAAPVPAGAPLELPPLPPMPDFGTLPPLPGSSPVGAGEMPQMPQESPIPQPPQEVQPAPAPQPTSTDPGQFRIPTQP